MAEIAEPVVVSSVTPAGLTVEYSPSPRRFYRVNGVEVPSVTTILDCLNKPGLSWHGMKVGTTGVLELVKNHGLDIHNTSLDEIAGNKKKNIRGLLTQHKLCVNSTLNRAGNRGTNVHRALEDWCLEGVMPHPEIYPDEERGYIEGLVKFLNDFGAPTDIHTEVMVGSAKHKFAGRFDLGCNWDGGEMVTKVYPVRKPKVELLPAGRWMFDAKTSSGVYESHSLQLGGYKGASDECGYEPYDYSAVIHLTEDGEYELVVTSATLEDFLAVRKTYEVMQKKMLG
jgi:hypothetical protein